MNTIVSVSNIGAFVLQAITLGLGVKSNTAPIRSILRQARSELHTAMEELLESGEYLEDNEFFSLRHQHDTYVQNINAQLQNEQRRDGFLMTVKSYKSAKSRARFYLVNCQEFKDEVSRVSQMARYAAQELVRVAKKQKQIEQQVEAVKQQHFQPQASDTIRPVSEDPLVLPPLAVIPRYGQRRDGSVSNPFRAT